MPFYSETLTMPENVFTILRDAIHDRLGLYYERDKRDLLASKLSARVFEVGLESFLEYYYLLKYDESADAEWTQVMDALSVPETYFWREFDHIQALTETLLPRLYAARRGPLRIWSAACANGEEPLTIAMALNEAGWFERMPIEITASDASSIAIAQAKQGIYRERSFRQLPSRLREKYFTECRNGWRVSPVLHDRVRWLQANLLARDEVAPLAMAHVIFCRNVMIYFSEQAIRKTVRLFFERMPSPGYLFVGTSESLLQRTTDFELQEIGGAFVYLKR